jgi:hypothetical protein
MYLPLQTICEACQPPSDAGHIRLVCVVWKFEVRRMHNGTASIFHCVPCPGRRVRQNPSTSAIGILARRDKPARSRVRDTVKLRQGYRRGGRLSCENAGPPDTCPTQSGEACVSQGLTGVRKAVRDSSKEMRFTALLHHLFVGLLRESFHSLKRKAAPGVDGVTWQEYERGMEERVVDLHSRVVS